MEIKNVKYKSDGCSGYLSILWRKIFNNAPPFEYCCVEHDIEYMFGSGLEAKWYTNFIERLRADNRFFICLCKSGNIGLILAVPIYIAVRLGGGGYLNTPYRWGFLYDYDKRKGYK